MLNIYKRVEKKIDNPHGVVEIKSISEVDKPFLLCISAQDNHDISIYGTIREGAQAARVYTTQEYAAGFKIDEFPIDFLGVRFKRDKEYNENYEEIVNTYLYPFLISKGMNIDTLRRQARRINLITYCDGTHTYKRMENRLEEKLLSDGLTTEEINSILSQISLVAIATMIDTRNLKATTITLIDVNDNEIATSKNARYKKMLQDKNKKCIYGYLGTKNNMLYVYDGNGIHSLKQYFKDGVIVKPVISSIISHFLENSIANEESEEFIPISSDGIIECLKEYANEEKDPSLLLRKLDKDITYGNAPRYTIEEAKIRAELDIAYQALAITQTKISYVEKEKADKERKLNTVIDGIRKYSSDTTFYQILSPAGLWQAPKDMDITQEKSDREIRELYSSINLDEAGPKL